MVSNSKLGYKPLRNDEIRLVKIQPGEVHQALHCSLEHASLRTKPRFTALSYVWGDPNKVVTIYINGEAFDITTNLHACLRHLQQLMARQPKEQGETVLMWVDAICINQNDNAEKSQAIPRMRDIYSAAEEVIGWLGENDKHEDPKLDLLFEMANLFHKMLRQRNISWATFISDTDESPICRRDMFKKMAEQIPNTSSPDDAAGLFTLILWRLFQRPWFERAWIIQEAILADNRLVMMAGAHWVPAVVLSHFIRAWESSARLTDHSEVFASLQRTYKLPLAIVDYQKQEPPRDLATFARNLQRLIGNTFSYKSSLPVDLIYARLGLLSGFALPDDLKPDYSQRSADVFHNYAKLCFAHTGSLSLLATERHQLDGVPSWVPDLRFLLNAVRVQGSTSNVISISQDSKVLRVEGKRVGNVELIAHKQNCSPESPESVRNAVRSFHSTFIADAVNRWGISPEKFVREDLMPVCLDSQWSEDDDRQKNLSEFYWYLLQNERPLVADESPFTQHLFNFNLALCSGILSRQDLVMLDNATPAVSLRVDASLQLGDVVCIVKGMPGAAMLRPSVEGKHVFLGACGLGGKWSNLTMDDDSVGGPPELWNLV